MAPVPSISTGVFMFIGLPVPAQQAAPRAELEAMGMPIGNLDLLIASHARTAGCVLVTHDKAFARVPGLVVEDWLGD